MTKTVQYIIIYITRITNWGYNVNFFMNQNSTNTRKGPQHQHITSTAPLTQDEDYTNIKEQRLHHQHKTRTALPTQPRLHHQHTIRTTPPVHNQNHTTNTQQGLNHQHTTSTTPPTHSKDCTINIQLGSYHQHTRKNTQPTHKIDLTTCRLQRPQHQHQHTTRLAPPTDNGN